MKPIGKVARQLGRDISAGRIPSTSSIESGSGRLPGPTGGGGGAGAECPRCGGVGWLRRAEEVGSPEFGRVYPCECTADEVARRRLAGVAKSSSFAALERMVFASFRVDAGGNTPEAKQSLRAARDAAAAFAEHPSGWLVLRGSYGCGKTHLAAAVVNERLRAGGSALFVVVPDLLDHLRSAMGQGVDDDLERRVTAVRDAPLLVLDDLGSQAPTPWANEKLFQILNYRYNSGLPTVITMNPDADGLDDRLRSRLGDMELVKQVEVNAIDYRGGIDHDRVEFSHLEHYRDATFEAWQQRTGELTGDDAANVLKAYDAARTFAESPQGWLVLLGPSGVGKTHLAAAIANHQVSVGATPLFIVVPDLLDHLRATFSPSSRVPYDQRFDEVRSARLLVLDDLGTESATPWAREKLFQILNHRYVAHLPTVITMTSGLDEIPARLRTRMLDRRRCRVFALVAPSFHGGQFEGRGRRPSR